MSRDPRPTSGWSLLRPTEPGLYDITDDDGASWWSRIQVYQVGKKFFIQHPATGKETNIAGLHGYQWRAST